jgi:hypothetical protein
VLGTPHLPLTPNYRTWLTAPPPPKQHVLRYRFLAASLFQSDDPVPLPNRDFPLFTAKEIGEGAHPEAEQAGLQFLQGLQAYVAP